MGKTIAEKIIAAHADRESVSPGEYVWARVDATAIGSQVPPMLTAYGVKALWDPSCVCMMEDHHAPPPDLEYAQRMVTMRRMAREYGVEKFLEFGRHGIIHEVFAECGLISPGDLIASQDSHSTTYGCFNVAACPVFEDASYVLAHGKLWFRVPHSIKFVLEGDFPGPENFVVGKDVILRIAGEYGMDVAIYKSAEFSGPAVHQMSMASRFTVSNMGVEIGAKFAIFPCDDKTMEYLEGKMTRPARPTAPDADAVYEAAYTMDTTDMPPYVARPHDPGNSVPVTEVEADNIKINQGFIGSCTNGKLEDFRMAARILKGRKVHPDVRLIASPGSQAIWHQCLKEGIWDIFAEAGALVAHSTCGPCSGTQLGLIGDDEVCVSTTNRNFQGRMGSPKSFVYLSNSATVAAAVVEGCIVDPRKFL